MTVRAFIWKPKGLQGKAVSDTADALKKHPTFTEVFLCFYYILCDFVSSCSNKETKFGSLRNLSYFCRHI